MGVPPGAAEGPSSPAGDWGLPSESKNRAFPTCGRAFGLALSLECPLRATIGLREASLTSEARLCSCRRRVVCLLSSFSVDRSDFPFCSAHPILQRGKWGGKFHSLFFPGSSRGRRSTFQPRLAWGLPSLTRITPQERRQRDLAYPGYGEAPNGEMRTTRGRRPVGGLFCG